MARMAFPLPDKPSIAVLPFDNLGGEPEQEILSDGLTNDIITDLSKFKHLFVIASNSTFSYKGKPVKVQQVAEELGVHYVLEGSFQRAGERLRINAQLIDATTGHHLWAERYDRDASNFFAIQEDILRTIVASLASQVTEAEIARALTKETGNLSAYDYFQRAWKLFFTFSKEGNNQALELLEKAIELDPDYARAYGLLAWVHAHNSSGRYSWGEDPDRSLDLALEVAQKAVALAPDDYFSHWALGFALSIRGDFDRANAEYERAVALNPSDATLLTNMAEVLYKTGRAEQAIAQIKLAMRINPHHPDWYFWDLGIAQYFAGQYQAALDTLNKMSNPYNGVRRIRAAVLVRLGRLEEAREVISKFIETDLEMTLEEMEDSPWQGGEYLDRWIADLRVAGLPEKRPPPLPDKPSIAVLPFTNMSDDPQQEYFVDGMTEDLITDLSKLSGLFVIARNSTFTYKGMSVKVRQVAVELGVRYVLEGSVRRVGNQVRINAQLIDATSGGHLWAERYDGSLQDIFALQDQVTRQIVTALEVSLTGGEEAQQARHTTDNAEAHDAFLQGWAHYKLGTPGDLARGIPHFEEAVRLDPSYAQAHAALASVYWDAYVNDWAFDIDMPSFRAEKWANEHLEKAIEAPTPLAHALQSRMYSSLGFPGEAVQEAEKAVALDGNDATAHAALANTLVLAERPAEGAEAIGKALRLDPHYPPSYLTILGAAQFGLEQYEEAAVTFERAVKRNPEDELPRIYLAASYGHLGRIDDGEAVIDATNYLRSTRGLGALSLEKADNRAYSTFKGEVDFKAFGGKLSRERVRSGLSPIPALNWQYLITTHVVHGANNSWFEVEGATKIDTATAKAFHDRGVLFVDTSAEPVWKKGHIPGAVNLPYRWDENDLTKPWFRETTLSKIVDRTEEFVIYCGDPVEGEDCFATWSTAKAVVWGYQKVYRYRRGLRGWREAGYPLAQDE